MKITEFEQFEILEDKNNPFSTLYRLDSGETFYLECTFLSQLEGLKEKNENDFPRVIQEMIDLVKKNKKIVFTSDYESPSTNVEDYIYLEITDVLDRLKIYIDDKSRGSDYGD